MKHNKVYKLSVVLCLLATALSITGCRQDMYNQSKYKPYAASKLFTDGRSARPSVEGSIARGQLHDDPLLYTGFVHGRLAKEFPFPITKDVMARGRERYDIFCAVCHDQAGTGRGLVVQRGFPQPSPFHSDRLRGAPAGYFYDVITNGYGKMYPYSTRIPVKDRWAIAAYIRALQKSQNSRLQDVPTEERKNLSKELVKW